MAVSSRPARRMLVREVEEAEVHKSQSKPKRKALRRLGFVLLALSVLVWFLPMIAVKTPLLSWAVNRFGNLKGQVTIQSASLGWLSAPSISGIEIRDEKNQPLLENLSVTGSNSLFGMICNPSNLGSFHLDKPKLTLRLRPDGSNLEDLIANYMTGESSSSRKIGVAVDISDATVEIVDETSKRSWQMDQFSLNLKMPAGNTEPMTVKTACRLPDPQKPGKLSAGVSLISSTSQGATGVSLNDLALQTENFPLDILKPVLARCGVQAQTAGWFHADIHTALADKAVPGSKTTVTGTAMAENFIVAMPALGKDQIRLASLRAEGKGSLSSERIDLEPTSVTCDLGNAQISGNLQLHDAAGKSNLTMAGLLRQSYNVNGRIDLARLAAMFPQLLHVRERTQITSGEVQASLICGPKGNDSKAAAMAWQGSIQAVNLTATDNGRPIAWPKPISAGFVAHEEPRGIVVETVQCDSNFLKITGSGTTDNLTASATFNLKQFADQLGQFVDISRYQLAGGGTANATWKRDAQGNFEAKSEIQLQNFQVVLSDQLPWQEPNLVTTLTASGQTDFSLKNTTVSAVNLNLIAGGDQFQTQLRDPVRDLSDGGVWKLQAAARGQLQTWLSRAAAFAPLTGYRAAGTAEFNAQLTASAASIIIADAKIHAEQFALVSPSLSMNEPQLDLTASGSWITKQNRLSISSALLTNSTLNVSVQEFALSMPEKGPVELAGAVLYRSNLARLQQCFADRTKPATCGLGGVLEGNAQFKQNGGVIHCETVAAVTNFAVAEVSGQQFLEPKITITAVGDYDNQTKTIKIDKADLSSSTVAASALAQVGMKTQTTADVNGQITYSLDRITDLLRPSFGKKVRLYGRGTGPVTWHGPLALDKAQAGAELQWDRAFLYGFDIGPAAIKPKLEKGVLSIDPMQVAVSQGKMFLAPKIRLASDPMELTMPAGPLAQQVQISPEMCDYFLKYISPILAGVTQAQGSFSIELVKCRLPIMNPKMGELAGKFTVHDVAIGPGPLIRAFAILLDREKPAQLRQQSVVNFQMANGRIYHDNMELIFPEFTIRTQGSVGIDDQSLSLQAQLPIPPKWLENNPLAPSLRNQTLVLPIGGTLSNPQLDQATLEKYTQQFIKRAVLGGLEEGLNQGLNQLFRKPQ